jgi:membrane protein implicated in regulation of membrane protease activity
MLPSLLHQSYLFTAILGIGITAIDMLGLLGAHHGDQAADHGAGHGATDHSTPGTTDHSSQGIANHAGHADHSGHWATNHLLDTSNVGVADHATPTATLTTSEALATLPPTGLSKLLAVLRYVRLFIYFSLGYGPVGLMAEYLGFGWWAALLWALGSGLVIGALSRAFFRFQQRDVDSTVQTVDLFLGTATVIVPITGGNMGKVRVQIGQSIAERYALAEDAHENFTSQTVVDIVRVTENCVYVRRAGARPLNSTTTPVGNLSANAPNSPLTTDFSERPTNPLPPRQPER